MSKIKSIVEELGGREKLSQALKANLQWLNKSFLPNKNEGSSGHRKMTGEWTPPYPETTGYLLSTLLTANKYAPELKFKEMIFKQYDFFVKLQKADGSFPQSLENPNPIVFDTAQIILGLLAIAPAFKQTPKEILFTIKKAKNWLKEQLNEEGLFTTHNYIEDYNPAYYSRIAWAILASEVVSESKASEKSKTLVARLAKLQNENLTFKDWSLHPKSPALTHNIAYTLRGLWECGEILNNKKLKKSATLTLDHLSGIILSEKKVAGTYDQNWKGDYSFICSTGNAQLALLYLKVFEKTKLVKYLEPVALLLKPLINKQRSVSINNGAIPSSIPIWGKYQRFTFSNWTQKFYSDTLMKLLDLDPVEQNS